MAATLSTFDSMLNEYLPNDLVKEQIIKQDWLLSNIEMDSGWKSGANLIVPFEGAAASSIKFGGLTDSTDVAEYKYVRGTISSYKEAWGTLLFNHKDLLNHDGKVSEKSFLKILPGQIESFTQTVKETLSRQLLSGAVVATVTDATNALTGQMVVDRIERFVIGQKLTLDDGDSAQTDVYVTAIDMNTSTVTLSATRGGAAANLSAYSVAQAAKFYHDGVLVGGTVTNAFSSVKDALLSAANGGSTNLYGVAKTAYPYLQAINISGADITAANINAKIFAAYNAIRQKGRGNANKVVMSYKHLGSMMALIETQKGPFKQASSSAASLYGWTTIKITSVSGELEIIGVQEMNDSEIFFLDMSALKFYSNGEMIKKRTAPDGKQYFETRSSTNGYQYLLDMCVFGDLVVHSPSKCGILYSISY